MPEASALGSRSDVRDDVELLAGFLERALEREVVVRADDELMRSTVISKQRRHPREEAVERSRFDGGFETRVELVVQRPASLHRGDVLRDAGEVDRSVFRHVERSREVGRQIACSVDAEDGYDATGKQRLDDLTLLVRSGRRRPGRGEPGLLPQDLGLELPELRAGLDAELLDEAPARVLVDLERFGLAAGAVEGEHQQPAKRLAKRMLADERFELADDV